VDGAFHHSQVWLRGLHHFHLLNIGLLLRKPLFVKQPHVEEHGNAPTMKHSDVVTTRLAKPSMTARADKLSVANDILHPELLPPEVAVLVALVAH
jgi:hypothetical protein